MDLKNAKAIVTGGGSGIGLAIAKALSEKGASVIISGRNEATLQKVATENNLFYFKADVSKEEDIKALFQFSIEKMNGLNVLINNAGIGTLHSLTKTSTEDFEQMWAVNAKGVFLAGKEAAKHFIEQKEGNIINIGSTAAVRGFATGSAYCASKFAVTGMTESWRAELRPHNIRVMQINPSEVVTDFIEKAGLELKNTEFKLKATEIAHTAVSLLEMSDIGFIPSVEVWATNPNRNE